MIDVTSIQLNEQNREEQIPGLDPAFPYIATRAVLNQYDVPWHWHRSAELFYVQSGCLVYSTPYGRYLFPAGSGGFVNSNVLHRSEVKASEQNTIQLLHLFDPMLISGSHNSRIEQKYVLPLVTSGVDLIALSVENSQQARVLNRILQTFSISSQDMNEIQIREALSRIWIDLLQLAQSMPVFQKRYSCHDTQIKAMMIYIQEHFREPVSVDQLAAAAHISRRLCFRLFQEQLHMSPLDYIRDCRLREACYQLRDSERTVTEIAYVCGLGSSSYFGKLFRQQFGCSPMEYRKMARSL